MNLIRVSGLRRVARRLRNQFASGGLILLYHRVAEVNSDPWRLCVSPRHFADHLEVLQKHGSYVRLQELVRKLKDRQLPRQVVAVTFDDGYADNLHTAKPLLERYDMPATIFITTGYIDQEREFWWDELDKLLLQASLLPKALHLSINGRTYRWNLGQAAHYNEEAYQRHRYWSAIGNNVPTSRHSLYRSLYQLLQSLLADEREKVLDKLRLWAGTDSVVRPSHRSLSSTELLALSQGELVEIGTHTVTHPLLSTLSRVTQRDEIQQSKASLEEIIGRPVDGFAYPHGDFTTETVALIREAGFAYACSTLAEVIWQGSDLFQLTRIVIENWDGEEFAKRLSGWFYA